MENTLLSISIKDLNKHFSNVRSQNHKEDHYKNSIKLYSFMFTIYQGFLPKGPGAKVESVPVANACP
jgi:hypothetical protein